MSDKISRKSSRPRYSTDKSNKIQTKVSTIFRIGGKDIRRIIFAVLLISFISTNALAQITVTPDTVTYNQQQGYETKTFTIHNPTNASVTVNITLSPSLSPYVIVLTHQLTISANSSEQFTAVFILNASYNGNITLTYENNTIPINVTVLPVTPPPETNITIIPSPPRAGKNMLIKMPEPIKKRGYIITDAGNVYLVAVEDGLGLVTLADNDYGTATLVIGNETMSFEIASSFRQLILECDTTITIGDRLPVAVYADTTPVMATVSLISPDGNNETRIVNGTATFDLDKVGTWNISATFQNMHAYQTVKVKPKPLTLSIPSEVEVNEPVTISIGRPAEVTISKDEVTWSYSTGGTVTFTPPWRGTYTVTVTTDDGEEGTASFTAKEKPTLVITDENGLPANSVEAGSNVIIKTINSAGLIIPSNSNIDVYKDGTYFTTISLQGGTAVYTIKEATSYRFTLSDNPDATAQILVKSTQSIDLTYILVVALVGIAVISVAILYKKGLIHIPELNLPTFGGNKYNDLF